MQVLKFEFDQQLYSFNQDGWFNATEAAKRFGQKAHEWLRLPSTERYMAALAKALVGKEGFSRFDLVRVQRGGRSPGTWLHPKMAVAFARWLSDDFGVWCDLQIDAIIRNAMHAEQTITQMLHDLERRELPSIVKGQIGSQLMHQRRKDKPVFAKTRAALMTLAQPDLLASPATSEARP